MLYIFDWDGTLCDSLSLITSSIQQSCEQLGLPVRSEEKSRSVIGLGLREAMVALYPELTERDIDSLMEAYRGLYVAGAQEQRSELFEGVIEVLQEFISRGDRLAVATGKSRKGLNRVLSQLDMQDFFHHSRCADETLSKPDPLMLNEILGESGFSASEAVMVGDTDFDLLMARAAGVKSVGVSYGAHSITRIRAARPDRIVDHLSELL